jgi:hypothetical protein
VNRAKATFKKGLADLAAKRSAKNAETPSSGAEAAAGAQDNDNDNTDASASDDGSDRTEDSRTDSNGDSWIINDEDENPPVQLPAKFSRQSYTRLIDSFVLFCHHLIQKLLDPEYTPGESLDLAVEALTRMIDEYTSALQGSTWGEVISRAMKARPAFQYKSCLNDSYCDACNRTNNAAHHAVSFTGPRYEKATLDNYEGSGAEDSEDSAGNSVVSETVVFHLGGRCFERVKTFHKFLHWKKSLQSFFEDILEEEGYLEQANLIEETSMSPPTLILFEHTY